MRNIMSSRIVSFMSGPGRGPRTRRSGNGSPVPEYAPGEPVPVSGIFEAFHPSHRETHEVVLVAGDRFPECETCGESVRFRPVHSATYIFHDDDFRTE